MLGPVGIRRRDGIDSEPVGDVVHRLVVAQIEHQQRLGMGRRSTVRSPGGHLEMRAGAGYREEDAVVAVMTAKATDLGEPDAVAVELDHLVEALGVAGDAQLHPQLRTSAAPAASMRSATAA